MALSFYKLHMAASSALVVDRTRGENAAICSDTARLEDFARLLLNRHCGAGGRALVCIDAGWPVPARAFGPDGRELSNSEDAWLCAARLAFDAGRGRSRTIALACPDGERRYEALASGTLATSLALNAIFPEEPFPSANADSLPHLEDADRARGVRLLTVRSRYRDIQVVLSPAKGPDPRSLYRSMKKNGPHGGHNGEGNGPKGVVWTQVRGRELLRFLCPLGMGRLEAAGTAAKAAAAAGLVSDSLVAEWAGPCGAVRYGTINAESPRELVTRGRFWARMEDEDQVLIAGSPEYAFEGSFEHD